MNERLMAFGWRMFFKVGILKNFAIPGLTFRSATLLKRDSNIGVFLLIL